jgi:hypothetical protein
VVAEGTPSSTEKYQEKIELLARELRKSINRAEKLEDAILKYVSEADRTGTMNPKNLKILRDVVTR